MSVDSVQPSLISQAVHPGLDARDDRNPDSPSKKKSKQSGKNQQDQADPTPVLNHLGEVMGRTVNITA